MTGDGREDLRRRLYRPGASPSDVDAYTSLGPAPGSEREPQQPQEPQEPQEPQQRPRSPRRTAIGLPVAALVVAGAVVVLVQPAGTAPTPAPLATRPVAAVVDVQRAAVVASTTEAERDGFVRALSGPRPVGLLGWSERHGRTGGTGVEYVGRGEEPLTFDLPAGPGRVEVLVVAARTTSVSWTLLAPGGIAVDRRSLYVTPGDVAEGALAYAAGRVPERLLVTAPAGVRWGVAVLADG